MSITTTTATEGGHWYTRGGEQIDTVQAKNGNARRPTVRDARKHGWLPGCTTIVKCAAAPALTMWQAKETVRACAELGPPMMTIADGKPMMVETFEDYRRRVAARVAAITDRARDIGTEVHGNFSRYVSDATFRKQEQQKAMFMDGGETPVTAIWKTLHEFVLDWNLMVERQAMVDATMRDPTKVEPDVPKWLRHLEDITQAWFEQPDFDDFRRWRSEDPVVHPLGYATKADFWTPEGGGWLFDFKGKRTPEDLTTTTYEQHHLQLAATREAIHYTHGVDIPPEQCRIIYFSREDGHEAQVSAACGDDVRRGWEMFCGLHAYWTSRTNHFPGWED